jgi:hypothetical protein
MENNCKEKCIKLNLYGKMQKTIYIICRKIKSFLIQHLLCFIFNSTLIQAILGTQLLQTLSIHQAGEILRCKSHISKRLGETKYIQVGDFDMVVASLFFC